jgi:hypothetical protein
MSRPLRPGLLVHTLVGVVVAAALVACGGDHAADVRTAGPVDGPAATAGPLPTLPSVDERHAGRFGPDGCAVTGSGSDCSVTADGIDAAQAGSTEAEWRTLAGFVGPRYTTVLTGGVRVLEDTVTSASSGAWRAAGLVRNEQTSAVGPVTVSATLFDASGATLGAARGDALLLTVRPGEPAPFEVAADVDATAVARVEWSVEAPPAPTAANRALELGSYWQRGLADPRPVDMYLFRDPAAGPHPFVLFGFAEAVGDQPVDATAVVGAWLDRHGQVVAVARATVVRPDGVALDEDGPARAGVVDADVVGPASAPTLEPGESADVLFVVDAATAPAGIDDAQLMLWGTGT